jgi:hypothetical protein
MHELSLPADVDDITEMKIKDLTDSFIDRVGLDGSANASHSTRYFARIAPH